MEFAETIEKAVKAAEAFAGRQHGMLIGGKWMPAHNGRILASHDPATERQIGEFPSGGAADIDLAVKAARKAFDYGPWPKMKGIERAKLLWRLAELIDENADELSAIETMDMGVPFRAARFGAVGGSADIARYLSGWAGRLYGDTIPASAGDWHIYTEREPVGVVGQIIPWNVPFGMAVSKICAALAAGCTVVAKPAELTSLSTLRLGELILEAGFPEDVVNIVTGEGKDAGAALAEHPDVDKISFTGSTATGKSILAASAGSLKRVTLELGGKSPVIILDDADLDEAIPGAANSVFANSGQVCVAGSRLFVHPKVLDKVMDGLVAHAARLKVGPGLDPAHDLGPLVSAGQMERVLGYVDSGRQEGAEIVHGGGRLGAAGYFVEPTIFMKAAREMKIAREEIFGPVMTVLPMEDDTLDTLARQANDTPYGLAATIWSRDIKKAHRLAKAMRAGSVRINSAGNVDPAVPFGGYKQSGIGRERGREGVEIYTELKSVVVAL